MSMIDSWWRVMIVKKITLMIICFIFKLLCIKKKSRLLGRESKWLAEIFSTESDGHYVSTGINSTYPMFNSFPFIVYLHPKFHPNRFSIFFLCKSNKRPNIYLNHRNFRIINVINQVVGYAVILPNHILNQSL